MNRRWVGIFLGLVLAFGIVAGAAAQEEAQPAGDIVFIIDESGSMFNDAAVVQRNLEAIVDTLQGRINYQLGLVGFGAFKGHSDTEFEGQPHVHQSLRSDVATFRRTLSSFVTVGQLEPGFDAVRYAMNADLGYRPEAGTCAVLITDEGADIYEQAPTTKAEAVQALQQRGASLIGIVNWGQTVDPGFDVNQRDYGPTPGGLIPEAGGKAFNVVAFRNGPAPVLRAVMEDCIRAINGQPMDTGDEQPSHQPERPGGSAEEQTPPGPSMTLMLERLRAQVESNSSQLFQLRNEVRTWTRELSSLRSTVSQLAERVPADVTVRINSVQASVEQVATRFEQLRARVDTLQNRVRQQADGQAVQSLQTQLSELETKLQQLQGVVGDLQERPALTDRLAQLESDVAALEEQSISVEVRQEIKSLRASFESSLEETQSSLATVDKRLSGISDTVARLGSGQQDQSARLEELTAQVTDVQAQLDGLPIAALQERLNTLAGRLSSVEQTIEQLQSRDTETAERLNTLANELSSLTESFESLRSLPNDVVQLRSSLGELDQRLSQRMEDITHRISANESAVGKLEQQVQETQAVAEKFMDNYAKVLQRLEGLRGEVAELQTQTPSVTREDLQALSERISGNGGEIGQLSDDLAALQKRLDGLSEAFDRQSAELESSIGKLQDQWAQLNDAFQSSNAKVSERLNKLASRQDQVESQLGQLREALGQMEEIRAQLSQIRQRLDELEPRVGSNEEGVSTNANAIAELRNRHDKFETTMDKALNGVDRRLSELEGRLADQSGAIEDLRGRLDGLQSDVEQNVVERLQQEGGVVRVEVQEDLLTRRLAQIALAFSLASIGIAWFLFMNR